MEFEVRASKEDALELMRAEWPNPNSGMFVEIKAIEDTGSIKMELTKGNKTPTRTEYEKVTESIFDLRDEFEHGELYGDNTGVTKIETLAHLGACCQSGNVFRKFEKEIDERDEFIEKVGDILPVFDKRTNPMWAGKLYDAGCRFVGE